jgi:hypothetical protein
MKVAFCIESPFCKPIPNAAKGESGQRDPQLDQRSTLGVVTVKGHGVRCHQYRRWRTRGAAVPPAELAGKEDPGFSRAGGNLLMRSLRRASRLPEPMLICRLFSRV